MSNLFSNIFTGITKEFQAAADFVDSIWDKVEVAAPGIGALGNNMASAEVSAIKQQVSNAFAYADTNLAPHFADATTMVESAADTLIMGLTHGLAGPLLPVVNVGLTQGFGILHAALNTAEAEVKSKFSLPPPTSSAAPTMAGAVAAATAAAATAAGITGTVAAGGTITSAGTV